MTRILNIILLAGALCGAAAAQEPEVIAAQALPGPMVRQEFGQVVLQQGDTTLRTQVIAGGAVTGKPFSATQEQHSLQILGDGTRIERTETSQISRDSMGRRRTEESHAPGEAAKFVTIQDPVQSRALMLNVAEKRAIVNAARQAMKAGDFELTARSITVERVDGPDHAIADRVISGGGFAGGGFAGDGPLVISAARAGAKPTVEDLGTQNVNGVLAKGTRTTTVIPAGQIGNDRPIQVVNERWYSDELQMVVKSSSSDPRFGTSEFNLTGIDRGEPDPSLFQIPADYAVNSRK